MFHSIEQMATLGGFILMIGFVSFILGCRDRFVFDFLRIYSVVVLANSIVSGFIAAITSLLINGCFGKDWSLLAAINGALAGMVSVAIGNKGGKRFIIH